MESQKVLSLLCPICNEFYKCNDSVYSTYCGHLFHNFCLIRWLNRSKTCPQCRRPCHRNRIHRVYLNYGERCTLDDDSIDESSEEPNWILLDEPTDCVPEPIPPGAIKAGTDADGHDIYVARVNFEEDLLPANYIPRKGGAYIPWNCEAHFVRDGLEILVDCNYEWVAASDGNVPPNAIVTGYTESGENLYTGRTQHDDIILPGKVHPSHKVLYMPSNGLEVNTKEYEVLVHVPKEKSDRQKN